MNFSNCLRHFVIFALAMLICSEAKRRSKGSKSRGGQKYSGKCKPKIMAEYELAFHGGWSESVYPRMFPKQRPPAQWSKLIGRTHSDHYTMWDEGSFASEAVQTFAEDGDTRGFDTEAQAYGGIRDIFTAAPIRGGLGKTATNFITDGSHSKVSFMVKLIPSPDWFVGVSSFDLCERNRWKSHIKLDLFPVDAGTDRGLTFTSPNWPSAPREAIYMLSPRAPAHTASSFHYPNMTSLPPIAKVYLTKISEYRRKGKAPVPLKQERNLVIFDNIDTSKVIPKLERIIDRAITQNKEARRNEIATPVEKIPAVDPGCIVSDWTAWTPCSVTCGVGHQDRRRTIVRRSVLPGMYCPVLREDRMCDLEKCNWESFQFLKQTG